MRKKKHIKGFTLVELLIALVITCMILTAVATLAFAMGTANKATDDLSLKQAQIRFATLRIQDLIRHSKLICFAGNNDIAIWRADDNYDGNINIGELVYIEAGPNQDHLRICEFFSSDDTTINLGSISSYANSWWSVYCDDVGYTEVVPECSNVQFKLDVLPPQSRFVIITFNIIENNIVRQCQITGKIRGPAINLLNEGDITSDDD
jgi:prepilin-type N-terminal cleavage/methylation domain-containing protein